MIGDRLGLYRALAEAGPMTSAELADYTGTAERYVREWLRGQAAGGYVTFVRTRTSTRCRLPSRWPSPIRTDSFFPGRSSSPSAASDLPAIIEARSGPATGFGWGEHDTGCLRRLRAVLPARLRGQPGQPLDAGRRRTGRPADRRASRSPTSAAGSARRAGSSPRPTRPRPWSGFDNASRLDRVGRKLAADAGTGRPSRVRGGRGAGLPRQRLGLVTTFDCLHDMGDPVAAARHIRQALGAGRRVADRRAVRRGRGGREPESGGPDVLLVLDLPLRTACGLRGRRRRAGQPGRRGSRSPG